MNPVDIRGERLSKSARQGIIDAKEARLTPEQRQHLSNLRDRMTNAEAAQKAAQVDYDRAVKILSISGAEDQARALREANARLLRAQVEVRTAELALGLTSSGSRPPTIDANRDSQGGPMPGNAQSAMQKAAQSAAFDRLTPEQREMHKQAAQEVRATKRGHAAMREALLEAQEGGNPTMVSSATQRHQAAAKAHHDAQVRLATLRKNFGLD